MSDESPAPTIETPTTEAAAAITAPADGIVQGKRAKQPVEAKIDARDEMLAKHLKKAGIDPATLVEESTASKNRRGSDGKFKKADPDSIEPGEIDTSSLTRTKEVAAEAKPKGGHGDDDIRKATAALQRDGSPKWMLDKLTGGDDETLAYALKRAKVQADGDDFTTKHNTLQQEHDELKKRPAANSSAEKGKSDATASLPDNEADKPLADLAELIGDDVAEPIRALFAGRDAKFAAELATRDQQIAALLKRSEASEISAARDALISEYPDLKDKEVWAKVRKSLDTLPESEDRPDMLTRLEHAARIELAPELIKRAKAEQQRRDKARDNGQPTPPLRAGAATGSKSGASLQDQLADAYERDDKSRIKELAAEIRSLQRST